MASRIARNPIQLPTGVEVQFQAGTLAVKGTKGRLELQLHPSVSFKHEENTLHFAPIGESKSANALAGTMRALTQNMVNGVHQGYERKLKLIGVGYRAQMKGTALGLTLGYSHPIDFKVPTGISIETPTQTEITIKGMDKQLVGQVAANIRAKRPPEPYKGKGICYSDEVIIRKETKKKK